MTMGSVQAAQDEDLIIKCDITLTLRKQYEQQGQSKKHGLVRTA